MDYGLCISMDCRICVALIPIMDRVLTPELSRVQSCEAINTIDKWQWQLQLAISIHCWLVFSEDGWVYHEQVFTSSGARTHRLSRWHSALGRMAFDIGSWDPAGQGRGTMPRKK